MATKKKYGKKAQAKVGKAMHEMKRGELRSGRSGRKVTNPKQAIAIGLSEARAAGGKVPAEPKSTRTKTARAAKKKTGKKKATKKAAKKKTTSRRTTKKAAKKKAAKKKATKKAAKKKTTTRRTAKTRSKAARKR